MLLNDLQNHSFPTVSSSISRGQFDNLPILEPPLKKKTTNFYSLIDPVAQFISNYFEWRGFHMVAVNGQRLLTDAKKEENLTCSKTFDKVDILDSPAWFPQGLSTCFLHFQVVSGSNLLVKVHWSQTLHRIMLTPQANPLITPVPLEWTD